MPRIIAMRSSGGQRRRGRHVVFRRAGRCFGRGRRARERIPLDPQHLGRLADQALQVAAPGRIGRCVGGERKPHLVGLPDRAGLGAAEGQVEAGGRVSRPQRQDTLEGADSLRHHRPLAGPDDRLAQHRQHLGIVAREGGRLPERVRRLGKALQHEIGAAEQEPALQIVGLAREPRREPLHRFAQGCGCRRVARRVVHRLRPLGEGAAGQPRRAVARVESDGQGRDAKTERQSRRPPSPGRGSAR